MKSALIPSLLKKRSKPSGHHGRFKIAFLFSVTLLVCGIVSQSVAQQTTGAVIRVLEQQPEAAVFSPGVKLFTDSGFLLAGCPNSLNGKNFLRGRAGGVNLTCISNGVLYVLTQDPANPTPTYSRSAELLAAGFVQTTEPAFQLFGTSVNDMVRTYKKTMAAGEMLVLGKWAVVLGFDRYIAEPDIMASWPSNTGETLYNGIRLPKTWPPRTVYYNDKSPMPVPYLTYPPAVIPIWRGRQLFVDDFLIEATTNLQREFHHATKYAGNPVLWPETALEGTNSGQAVAAPKSGGVWWNPARNGFQMWYEAKWLTSMAYATSTNGLTWKRPNIIDGTNRILPATIKPDSSTVFIDRTATNVAERFKMFLRRPGGAFTNCADLMVSQDGVNWNWSSASKTGGTGDRSTMFYNPFRNKWVYSLRDDYRDRSRRYWESSTFTNAQWRTDEPVLWAAADNLDVKVYPEIPGQPPLQLYNLDAAAYESIMLGVFQIWHGPDNNVCASNGLPKTTELQLAYSRDGFHWSRPDRTPFIRAERGIDTWDRGYVQSVGGLCLVRGDKLWFYYTGFRGHPDGGTGNGGKSYDYVDNGSTGVAFLRRDGFASMNAGSTPGTLITRPLRFTGKYLFVNAEMETGGQLRAEIVDSNGAPISPFTFENCVPVKSNGTVVAVGWTGASDLSSLISKPVRVLFDMQNGKLYSFWVSSSTNGRSDGYVAAGGPGFSGLADTAGTGAMEAEKAVSGKKTVYVILFGGQSNALGWGYQQYLEDTGNPLRLPQSDVEMFYTIAGTGLLPENTLLPLQSGNSNTNVKQPGEYPALTNAPISRFGPELSFARTVRDRIYTPDTKVAVIKFAHGGSSLWDTNDWRSGGTSSTNGDGGLYRVFQSTVSKGIAALQAKYPDYTVKILGMGWVQGESDALENKGAEYQTNLENFIADVRMTYGTNLPFVLSKISPNQISTTDTNLLTQWSLVRAAQDAVAATVPGVVATETTGSVYTVSAGLSEGQIHFNTPALLRIGRDLGDALIRIGWENNP
ncbi:MAG: sialate O-acetylesterase [Kiritimatiellales bacterium]|jgi:hypothetical protein